MKTESRTIQQNNAYFLFQEQIAHEMISQSISLANLVAEIQPKPTKTSLHEVFKSICHSMYKKQSTTQLTREEMQNVLEIYLDALAIVWININFPSAYKNNLLSFYE